MALTNMGFKDPNWCRFGKGEKREGRGRRRREEEEGEIKPRYGTWDFCVELILDMDHMNFVWNSRKVYEFQT